MTTIYLVRHAQAQGNLLKSFQGHTDTPLTGLGLTQASQVAARFAPLPLDAVYASPLTRARQTAEAIAAHHDLTPVIEPGLIEIDGGGIENMSFDEIMARYPREFEQFNLEPHNYTGIQGGESILSVYERMVKTMKNIAARHPGGTIAAVSHGCSIRCFLCFAKAYPLERLGEMEWGRNTGVSHLTFEEGSFLLHGADDVSHLTDVPREISI